MPLKRSSTRQIHCKSCNESYFEGSNHERSAKHVRNNLLAQDEPVKKVESAARGRLETYFIKNQDVKQTDFNSYLRTSVLPIISKKIRDVLVARKCLKVNILVYSEYVKPELLKIRDFASREEEEGEIEDEKMNQDETVNEAVVKNDDKGNENGESEAEKQIVSFKTKNIDFFRQSDVDEKLNELIESILREAAEFHMKGSGWTLSKIMGTELRLNQYDALSRGSSYIPLPIKTHCVVNVQNNDHQCFKYAVLGKHLPNNMKHKYRPSKYNPYFDKYDFSCVSFPVPVRDIPKFERANDVSISVFGIDGYDDDEDDRKNAENEDYAEIGLGPDDYIQNIDSDFDEDYNDNENDDLFLDEAASEDGRSKHKKKKRNDSKKKPQIYPLRVAEEEKTDHIDLLYFTKGQKSHYCWISNFEGLVQSQLTKDRHKNYICKKCFAFYREEGKLIEHKTLCAKTSKDSFLPVFPKQSILEFKNRVKTMTHKYVAYCDFESYLRDLEFDPANPTFSYQHHKPMSYAYTVVSPDPHISTDVPVIYRGPDPHIHYVDAMIDLVHRISTRYQIGQKIRMSEEDEIAFAKTTRCQLCEEEFTEDNPKCRDHDHQYITPNRSNYRMALCSKCNREYRHPKSLICVFHNLSKYDLHFIVKALNGRKNNIEIIPSTEETYISLTLHTGNDFKIRFIDSYRFLAGSLDNLVRKLPDSAFIRTRNLCNTEKQLELVKLKGIFCYDYVTDDKKLLETAPPPKNAFYSKLKKEHISNKDYERFCATWVEFGFANLGDYSDFYLKLDVCLLADVFQEFRAFARMNYNLDCANYLTLPSFAFDAFLKMTKVRIDSFTDVDKLNLILNNIRGGISQCSLRHAVANNPEVPETYNPEEPHSYLKYFDVTALYAFTMCKPLPYGEYEWVSDEDLKTLDVRTIPDDGDVGYILEVDIDYPDHLHHLHSDLPFLVENKVPPMLGSKFPKLLATLEHKRNYVIHFVALKQALKHGLVLKNTHKAIRFKQRPYLKEFIDLNARLRQEAKGNDFQQNLLKLCSNACYGKFLENPLKRRQIVLATHQKQIMKYISKAEFLDRKIFDEELVAIELHRKRIKFDRPVIVGFSILDLSKVHMYGFHYDVMLKRYPRDDLNLCYTDTDSYVYKIKTINVHRDMLKNIEVFDTSNFPKDHPCFSEKNYKVMGTLKDETGGIPIKAFCGLRSKLYAFIKQGEETGEMRAKGVQTSVLKKTVNYKDYIDALYQNVDVYRRTRQIRSEKHELYSLEQRKKALSSFDDKRFILQGSVVSLPYGHVALRTREWWSNELKMKLENFNLQNLCSTDKVTGINFNENLIKIEKKSLDLRKQWYLQETRASKRTIDDEDEGGCDKKLRHT